ncbi:MAG: hypothetical protein ACI84R_002368 [Candidatus Azotimanducaceae bacterium]|jgi:hypothetical protein
MMALLPFPIIFLIDVMNCSSFSDESPRANCALKNLGSGASFTESASLLDVSRGDTKNRATHMELISCRNESREASPKRHELSQKRARRLLSSASIFRAARNFK